MKFLLTSAIILLGTLPFFAQNEKPSLKITGNVKEIAMQEVYPNTKSAFYVTYIKLNLKITNTGSIPLIFLNHEPASIKYATVIQPDKTKEIFLAETLRASSSYFMMKKDWEKLKKELDEPLPPEKQTLILAPRETVEFEAFMRLNVPKTPDGQLNSSNPTRPLNFIQQHSPALIKAEYETWSTLSLFINGKNGEDKKKEFANKLRKQWKNTGYLWTEEIQGEPISIDFNSVIFKTLLN